TGRRAIHLPQQYERFVISNDSVRPAVASLRCKGSFSVIEIFAAADGFRRHLPLGDPRPRAAASVAARGAGEPRSTVKIRYPVTMKWRPLILGSTFVCLIICPFQTYGGQPEVKAKSPEVKRVFAGAAFAISFTSKGPYDPEG